MPENSTRSERLAMLLACGSPGSAAAYHGLPPRFEVDLMQRNATEAASAREPEPIPGATSAPLVAAWFDRLIRPFRESIWQQELRDREAYLAGAQNIADVEARMRVLERAAFSRHGALG